MVNWLEVLTMRYTSSLCMAIKSPLICWFAHVERRCGNVSLSLFRVKLGLVGVSGKKIFFQ